MDSKTWGSITSNYDTEVIRVQRLCVGITDRNATMKWLTSWGEYFKKQINMRILPDDVGDKVKAVTQHLQSITKAPTSGELDELFSYVAVSMAAIVTEITEASKNAYLAQVEA